MKRLLTAPCAGLLLGALAMAFAGPALGDAALCSPLDKLPASEQLPGDNVACCDGVVSDDGCGPDECEKGRNYGKPVDALSGFAWLKTLDLSVAMPWGPAMEFERSYSTHWAQSHGGLDQVGVLGPGWSHSYASRLELSGGEPAPQVVVRWANTRSETYSHTGGGEYGSRHPSRRLWWDGAARLYVLEREDATAFVFDTSGNLVVIREADGGEARLVYSGEDSCLVSASRPAGMLCRVDFVFGQSLWFTYRAASPLRLEHVAWDEAGLERIAEYRYSPEGELFEARLAGSETTQYRYEFTHAFPRHAGRSVRLLTSVHDGAGIAVETFGYHQYRVSPSRVVSHTTQEDSYSFEYEPKQRRTTISSTKGRYLLTWQNGRVSGLCPLDEWRKCDLGRQEEYVLSTTGPVATLCERNADGATRFERDALGRKVAIRRGLGSCDAPIDEAAERLGYVEKTNRLAFESRPSVDPSTPGARSFTIWDYTQPSQATDPFCGSASCQTPGAYNKPGAISPRIGQTVRIGRTLVDLDGTWDARAEIVRNGYGLDGQLAKVDGPRRDVEDVTEYEYYPATAPGPEAGRLRAVRVAGEVVAAYSAYNRLGKPEEVRDEAGVLTRFAYDAAGRLLSNEREGDARPTTYEYVHGRLQRVWLPMGNAVEYRHDAAGRISSVAHLSSSGEVVEEITYDRLDGDGATLRDGRVTAESHLVRGEVVRTTSFEYDHQGRRALTVSMRDGGQKVLQYTKFDEQGRVAWIADANHLDETAFPESARNVEHLYDALGRLSQVRRLVEQDWVTVSSFDYDVQGSIARVVDALGMESLYRYDDFGRLVEVKLPDAQVRRFLYDESGNLVKERVPDGKVIERRYDARNRLVELNAPGLSERFAYGEPVPAAVVDCATSGSLETGAGAGRLTRVEDSAGTQYFGYTNHGQRVWEARLGPGETCAKVLRWEYNANGNLTALRYPSGHRVEYLYEAASGYYDRPHSVRLVAGGRELLLASQIGFEAGELTTYLAGNGLRWRLRRQFDGTPAELTVNREGEEAQVRWRGFGPRVDGLFEPGLDGLGNPLAFSEDQPERDQSFAYDPSFGRLIDAQGPYGAQGWGHAMSGDTVQANGDSQVYLAGTHRLRQSGTTRFTYSESGAVWRIEEPEGTRTLCYDPKEQVRGFVGRGGEVLEQLHDAWHRRVATIGPVNGRRVDYRYAGSELLVESGYASLKSQWPRPTVEYVWLGGRAIAAVHSEEEEDGRQTEARVAYLFGGHLGEVLVEADEAGNTTWMHTLEPYGARKTENERLAQVGFAVPNADGAMDTEVLATGARGLRLHFTGVELDCGRIDVWDLEGALLARIEVSTPEVWTAELAADRVRVEAVPGEEGGEAPRFTLVEAGLVYGSARVEPLSLRTQEPYPAAGQQFTLELDSPTQLRLEGLDVAECDEIEVRQAGRTLWRAPREAWAAWTPAFEGQVQVGIWGQGCNEDEGRSGFALTARREFGEVLAPVGIGLPGQYYQAEMELVENWSRYYNQNMARYLQPDGLLATLPAAGAEPSFRTNAISSLPYSYADNAPIRLVDPDGMGNPVMDKQRCIRDYGCAQAMYCGAKRLELASCYDAKCSTCPSMLPDFLKTLMIKAACFYAASTPRNGAANDNQCAIVTGVAYVGPFSKPRTGTVADIAKGVSIPILCSDGSTPRGI